jgi:hypothetical protein
LIKDMQEQYYPRSVNQFGRSDLKPIALDKAICEHLDFAKLGQKWLAIFRGEWPTERFGVQSRAPRKEAHGVQLLGYKGKLLDEGKAFEEPIWEKVPIHSVTISGIQFRHDWEASLGGDWMPFPDLLDQQKATHFVLIGAPWLPSFDQPGAAAKAALARRARDPKQTTTFVTPASFSVLLVALVREFVAEPLLCTLTAGHAPGSSFNAVNIRNVLKVLDTAQVTSVVKFPRGIRERLITRFEVEIEADGGGAPAGTIP